MSIDISTYPTLNTYAVLAATGITTVNPITITNGFYGSSAPSYSGTFVGTVDSTNAGTAQTELTTSLIGDINAFRATLPPSALVSPITTPIILYPNIDYNSGSSVTFAGVPIVLDAGCTR